MKTLFLLSITYVYTVLMISAAQASEDSFTILTPPDKSSLDSQIISIVVQVNKNALDGVVITINGRKQPLPRKNAEKGYICFDGLHLSPGKNRISIAAFNKGVKVGEQSLSVFSRSRLSSEENTAPAGFKSYFFHQKANEARCITCHQTDFKGIAESPASPDKSPCYTCHKKKLESSQYVHGPASVWSCSTCHTVKQDSLTKSKLDADDSTCTACHADSVDLWKSMKSTHGPVAAGSCSDCHDPHSSDQRYFLRKQITDLCLSCHETVETRPHVISGFSGKGHPLRFKSDPLRPGNEFSCTSCHNPHASNDVYILNFNKNSSNDYFEFCKSCHKF